jgi:hypothetical protein
MTLNSQRLYLGDTEDLAGTLAGPSEDTQLADRPHLYLKKQKHPSRQKT